MKYIKTFEKYDIKNPKRVKKDAKKGGGASRVVRSISDKDVDSYEKIPKSLIKKSLLDLDGILVELKKRFKKFVNVTTIKYLDEGSYGIAFAADDKVIKLTSNKSEAELAKTLVGKKYDRCVKYYDVVFLEKFSIFAILMDKAKNLTEKEEAILDEIDLIGASAKNIISSIIKAMKVKKINCTEKEATKIFDEYQKLKDTLEKQEVPTDDLHSGNIGWLKGKLVHFDIMDSGFFQKKQISKL